MVCLIVYNLFVFMVFLQAENIMARSFQAKIDVCNFPKLREPYSKSNVTSFLECVVKCSTNTHCVSLLYNKATLMCWMFNLKLQLERSRPSDIIFVNLRGEDHTIASIAAHTRKNAKTLKTKARTVKMAASVAKTAQGTSTTTASRIKKKLETLATTVGTMGKTTSSTRKTKTMIKNTEATMDITTTSTRMTKTMIKTTEVTMTTTAVGISQLSTSSTPDLYLIISNGTWQNMRDRCEGENAMLVKIDSQAKQDQVADVAKRSGLVFIAIGVQVDCMKWLYTDNTKATYQNFVPFVKHLGFFAIMSKTKDYRWVVGTKVNGGICERL